MEKTEFYIGWQITPKCNLSCSHCYTSYLNTTELSLEKKLLIVEKIASLANSWELDMEVSLEGGEPLLSKDLWVIANELKRKGIRLNLLTNGTLIDDNTVKNIKKIGFQEVQLSLDGLQKTHDSIRGKGTYLKTISGLKKLVENSIPVSVNFVVSKKNAEDLFPLIEELKKIGVNRVKVAPILPVGAANNKKDLMLTQQELKGLYEEYKKRLGTTLNRSLWCLLDQDVFGACSAGTKCFAIAPNGDLHPCALLLVKIGNILEDDLSEILENSPIMKTLRQKEKIIKCGSCEFLERCGGCRAAAYGFYGDYMEKDPYCWL